MWEGGCKIGWGCMEGERSIGLCVRCLAVCLEVLPGFGAWLARMVTSSACLPKATPCIADSTKTEQKQYKEPFKKLFFDLFH